MTYFNKHQLPYTHLFVVYKSFIFKLLLIKISGRRLVNLQSDINIKSPLS